MKITKIETALLPYQFKNSWLTESVIANPMSIYPEYYQRRSSWRYYAPDVLIKLETDNGISGYGLATGGEATEIIIKNHLQKFIINSDPFNIEKIWDQMFRATLPYGRKGLPIMGISGVDIALWDIICKAKKEPLYRMLGGKVRDKIPVYITGNDIRSYQKFMDFKGYKIAMAHGPIDGIEGMKKNEEKIAETRDIIGPGIDLMIDCYMAWDLEYTKKMAQRLEKYNVRWIEEPLPPDDISGYVELRKNLGNVMITTGEHEYTRWGFRELIERGAVDIVQPDVQWSGGITEIQKVFHIASAWNLPVTLHAGGVQPWAVHMMFSNINCPMCEFLCTFINENKEKAWKSIHLLKDGYIYVSDEPGVGISVDDSVFNKKAKPN